MTGTTFTSQRSDGRGHWPRGRERPELRRPRSSTPADRWAAVRAALVKLLKSHPLPEVRSRRALAGAIGRDHSTVSRWLSRGYVPDPQTVTKIDRWLKRQLAALGSCPP